MDQHDSIFKLCLITVESIAGMMSVSEGYVSSLMKSGKVPYIMMEGEEKIRMWDMMNYVEKNLKQHSEVLKEMKEMMKGEEDGK